MNEEDKKDSIESISNEVSTEKMPLVIFKTDADIYGCNISAMSNFFDGYVQEMSLTIRKSDGL